MSYTPKPGDYGVVKTSGIVGRLIRLGTTSRWNHVVICINPTTLVEANPTGVAVSQINKYKVIAWNQHEILTDSQRKTIVEHAQSLVGKPYGFFDIFVIFLRILGLRLPPQKLWNNLSKRMGYICSELAAECYSKAGFELINKPVNLVTPGDLAERLIYQ
jgi:hypothetical protein